MSSAMTELQSEVTVKTYFPPDLQPMALYESASIISGGTTGLFSWTASFILADYFLTNYEKVFNDWSSSAGSTLDTEDDVIVLELGAGTGLLSILTSQLLTKRKMSPSVKFISTDHHPKVLRNLSRNITLNHSNAVIEELDWMCIPANPPPAIASLHKKIKVIIASDVVFHPSLIPHLVDTMVYLLADKGMVYMATTIRNEETWQLFIDCIEKDKLALTPIDVDVHCVVAKQWLYPAEPRQSVRLFELHL